MLTETSDKIIDQLQSELVINAAHVSPPKYTCNSFNIGLRLWFLVPLGIFLFHWTLSWFGKLLPSILSQWDVTCQINFYSYCVNGIELGLVYFLCLFLFSSRCPSPSPKIDMDFTNFKMTFSVYQVFRS